MPRLPAPRRRKTALKWKVAPDGKQMAQIRGHSIIVSQNPHDGMFDISIKDKGGLFLRALEGHAKTLAAAKNIANSRAVSIDTAARKAPRKSVLKAKDGRVIRR